MSAANAIRFKENTRLRHSFAKISTSIGIPDLISIQRESYRNFLQLDADPQERQNIGLENVFRCIFPIRSFSNSHSLEYKLFRLDPTPFSLDECYERKITYASPLKLVIQLVEWVEDPQTHARTVGEVKEQEVFFGEIPLMTDAGTFVFNGIERVIVSQLHRSPGVYFSHDAGKGATTGKLLYSARVIPARGSWLDFEFDSKDHVHVRIDKRRKMYATILLRALGCTEEQILADFYPQYRVRIEEGRFLFQFDPDLFLGRKLTLEVRHGRKKLVEAGRKITKRALREMSEAGVEWVEVAVEDIAGMYAGKDVVAAKTGKVICEINTPVDDKKLQAFLEKGVEEFALLYIDRDHGSYLRDTLAIDGYNERAIKKEQEETPQAMGVEQRAIMDIYRRLQPSDLPTVDAATAFFNNLFFNTERYDLSKVGRIKINHKLDLSEPLERTTLTQRDIVATLRRLIECRDGRHSIDDIDHLANRRVRAVGELLEDQFRAGLVRMERTIKEKMSFGDLKQLMPHDLINSKPVAAMVKKFFGGSQLSQFMDQINPLSEITHKRRLSALGPGGLTRERAGFEVRDVHSTHYGRICPIETPEGPNIGLIVSLSTFAKVNEYGFIETPYRRVVAGRPTDDIAYYAAYEETDKVIAQANAASTPDGRLAGELVTCRYNSDFVLKRPEEIHLMDVSPSQLVSVSSSLIPFLEHDDANRALMGSNMQRQAVPLLRPQAPLIGTGMEKVAIRDSTDVTVARRGGTVERVTADRIIIRVSEDEISDRFYEPIDIYLLKKFQRSNQNTLINQRPIVNTGDRVERGEVIADGAATEKGELAIGQNVLVAFMPWGGYNFEDSIIVSERVVRDDRFTSIHIEEFEVVAREIKLGKEEITRDIPNLSEEALAHLDKAGIVKIGTQVKPGDILVGKVTPQGETQESPEENLLRAIFGDKAKNVKDTSLRVPHGIEGTVIDVKVFTRKGVERDSRAAEIEKAKLAGMEKEKQDIIAILQDHARRSVAQLARGRKLAKALTDRKAKVSLAAGDKAGEEDILALPYEKLRDVALDRAVEVEEQIRRRLDLTAKQIVGVIEMYDGKMERVKKPVDLQPGVRKMVKVSIAMKRQLQAGDKLSGRHGNKGVISRVVPREDMPFLANGQEVDVILNPLGVPSRMNVGQVLETHLGWAARGMGERIGSLLSGSAGVGKVRNLLKGVYRSDGLDKMIDRWEDEEVLAFAATLRRGVHLATPVFDGAKELDIERMLEAASLPAVGRIPLQDGRTGDAFGSDVTIGVMYILKLNHLVEDKIHARSIGSYSLVTQQPLGGKAQFGGQRLGEMEVWAIEAYGAAHTLQEFLTVKSDDIVGRTRIYQSIIKDSHELEPGLPESFSVLIKELRALALDVELGRNR